MHTFCPHSLSLFLAYGMLYQSQMSLAPAKPTYYQSCQQHAHKKQSRGMKKYERKRIIIRKSKRRTKGGRDCDVLRKKMQKGGEAEDEARRRIGSFGNGEAAELAPNCECCGWLVPSSGLSLERD